MDYASPAAAFSSSLEDFMTKRAAAKRQQMLDELAMRKQAVAEHNDEEDRQLKREQMQMQREDRASANADKLLERQRGDVLKSASLRMPGDIPSYGDLQQAERVGLADELFPKPQTSLPGIAAVPVGRTQVGMTPSADASVRPFAGTAAERATAKKQSDQQAILQGFPEGSPERTNVQMQMAGMTPIPGQVPKTPVPDVPYITHAEALKLGHGPANAKILEPAQPKMGGMAGPVAAPGTIAGMSPEGLDTEVISLMQRGKDPTIGRTSAGIATWTAIINRRGYLLRHPEELVQAIDSAPSLSEMGSKTAALDGALKTLNKIGATAENAARTATDNLDLALKSSPKVTRTDSAWVNKHVQSFMKGATAVPELTDFETKIYVAAREYAKVASGSSASVAGLSDTATTEAEKLLNAAKSPRDLEAAISAMKADMANIISNYHTSSVRLQKEIGGVGRPGNKKTADDYLNDLFPVKK